MANTRTTFRQRSWGAWAGDLRELEAIARILQESIQDRQQEAVQELSTQIEFLEQNDDGSDIRNNKISRLKASHERIRLGRPELFVRMDVVDQHETVSGPVREVLAEIDRRSTKSVTITASPYRYLAGDIHDGELDPEKGSDLTEGISVHFGAKSQYDPKGVQVFVTSPSTGWARSTFARIVDEVEKGVPRWAPLRRQSMVPAFIMAIAFAVVGFAIGYASKDYWSRWDLLPTLGGILGLLSYPLGFGSRWFDWTFPSFEVTGEGAQASGARRLAFILSLAASIPIGILVNAIT